MSPPTRFSHEQRSNTCRGLRRLVISVVAGVLFVVACSPAPSVRPSAETSAGPTSSAVSARPSPPGFTTLADYISAVAACLRDAGWNVKTDGLGGLSADITAGQRPAFLAARETCRATLGDPPAVVPASEAEIRARYAYFLDARDCLTALGYTIGEPPTIERFIESYTSGPWSPFNDLAGQTTSQAEWDRANQACPQVPGE